MRKVKRGLFLTVVATLLFSANVYGATPSGELTIHPAEHPVFPDRQKADLLEKQLPLVRRHRIRQTTLCRIQAIKKESFKLSRRNCIFISRRPGAAMANRILVAWLAAALFRNVAFGLQRCVWIAILPAVSIFPAPDRSLRDVQCYSNIY